MSEAKQWIDSKEHYDLLEQFERAHKLTAADREKDKDWWRRGYVYWHGETNLKFIAYRCGYSFGKRLAADEAQARIDQLEAANAQLQQQLAAGGVVSPEVQEAIGYCWRWAHSYAEKGGADTDQRYEFMSQQIDTVMSWWESNGGWQLRRKEQEAQRGE